MSIPSSRLDVATIAGSRPSLSASSIASALLARDRAVVGPDELLAGELVEPLGEPFGQPAAVAEDDRRAVRPDELEDPRVDRRPDADPRLGARPPGRRAAPRAAAARRAGSCPRPARRPTARAACAPRRRRSRRRGPARAAEEPGDRRRAVAGWPTARSAGAARASLAAQALRAVRGVSARWAPRFVPAIAWTSSTMTCSTPRRLSRAWLVSSR